MKTPTITIRIDKDTKEKAQKVLGKIGLDLSSAIKLFLNNVIMNESIPFEIKAEKPEKSFREHAKENLRKSLSKQFENYNLDNFKDD